MSWKIISQRSYPAYGESFIGAWPNEDVIDQYKLHVELGLGHMATKRVTMGKTITEFLMFQERNQHANG